MRVLFGRSHKTKDYMQKDCDIGRDESVCVT